MARNDRNGSIPTPREWQDIQAALQLARQMANNTAGALRTVEPYHMRMRANIQQDPRTRRSGAGVQAATQPLLATHYRLGASNPMEVRDLKEAYERVHQRLTNLGRQSFRLVSHDVANAEQTSGGDVFGYVRQDQPNIIFLNETYFSQQSPQTLRARPASPPTSLGIGQVLIDPNAMRLNRSLEMRASIILHETVHLLWRSAGAVHRALDAGRDVDTETVNCDTGYPQVRSYVAAFSDAYVVTRFARCVHRAQNIGTAGSIP